MMREQRSRRLAAAGILALLVAGTLLLYWPVSRHSYVNFDDEDYVTANSAVSGGLNMQGAGWAFTTTHAGNWHPLTWLSLMADTTLFGQRAGSHLLVNVALHIASAVLLFAVLARMTAAIWASALVAALFAVHPLHVESVAWVSERKDVLSAFLWMLALLAYERYVRRPGPARYLLVAVAFAAGLAAKPMLVTLPCVLLLLDVWPLGRLGGGGAGGRPELRRLCLLEKAPLLLLSGLSCFVTFVVQQRADFVRTFQQLSFPERLGNALEGWIWYIGKMLWPADLAVFYPFRPELDATRALLAAGVLALATAGVLAAFRRRPALALGWFWYLGTLVPVIGLVQVGLQATADRYSYLPLIGLFIALAWGLRSIVGRSAPRRAAAVAGVVLTLAALGALSRHQLGYWQDTVTLLTRANTVAGGHFIVLTKLGAGLSAQGRYAEAASAYRDAIRLEPRYAPAHFNLGIYAASTGDLEGATAELRTLAALDPGAAGQLSKFLEFFSGGRRAVPGR